MDEKETRPGGVRVGVGMGGVRQVEDVWRFLRREQAKRPSKRHNKERRRRREEEEALYLEARALAQGLRAVAETI